MAYMRDAELFDVRTLAPRLRPADKAEIAAGSGEHPYVSLSRSVAISTSPKAIIHNEQVICLFGVAPMGNGVGAPWLMASPELPEVAIPFLRQGREVVAQWRKEFKLLTNTVDCRNIAHHRWLQWLGFKFIRVLQTHGVEDRPFYEFVMIGEHHV